MLECLLKITGKVQGVFYRATTQKKAQELGVMGWVRNCSDGSVEALFQGEEDVLGAITDWCWHGPDHAQVENVVVLYSKPCMDACDRFTIR
jgi:acylphosphatase